jgi:hypothetical protein
VNTTSNQPQMGINENKDAIENDANRDMRGAKVVAVCSWVTAAALIILAFLRLSKRN